MDFTKRMIFPFILCALLLASCGQVPAGDEATEPPASPTPAGTAQPSATAAPPIPTPDRMPADAAQLSVTYTCNEGFILAADGKKILVDVLFSEEFLQCENGAEDEAAMRRAGPPFDGADLVLVTHVHSDHFDAGILGEYMLNNPRAILITTAGTATRLEEQFADYAQIQERVQALDLAVGEAEQMTVQGIELQAIVSSPDGHSLGFVIRLGDYTIYHTGDSGISQDMVAYLEAFGLPGMGIDIALVPYWYLGDPQFTFILDGIRAQYYIPMHYAPLQDDDLVMFATVPANYPQALLFGEELQTMLFPPDVQEPLSGNGGGVIAFTSTRDGNMDIYIMNADGSDQRRLTSGSGNDAWGTWSPDGTRIAYHSVAGSNGVLKGIDIASSFLIQWQISLSGDLWEPAWSHDGQWLAFSNQASRSESDIYVMSVDGEHLFRLTDTAGIDGGPFWSPDDSQIAFYSDRDGNFEVYVMDADGSNQRRLTDDPADDLLTSWSPDGTRLAFFSNREGNDELYTINVDGSGLTRLTEAASNEREPAFSPDGSLIAFASDRDGNFEIYVAAAPAPGMPIDEATVRRLTDTPASEMLPVWMPTP